MLQLLASPELMAGIVESYVLIAETDHVLLRPLPNLASEVEPAAYHFGYMTPRAGTQKVTGWRGGKRRVAMLARSGTWMEGGCGCGHGSEPGPADICRAPPSARLPLGSPRLPPLLR